MKIRVFYEFLQTAIDTYEDEFDPTGKTRVIGVRWEELDRNVGDEVGCSKHNPERENESDMPEYGSEEYENMFELDGASSLSVNYLLDDLKFAYQNKPDANVSTRYIGTHCYLIGGRHTANESDGIDEGEYVIVDASVLVKLY